MAVLALGLMAAACADTDPCAGHGGTCLALTVTGQGSVDQLAIGLSGAATLDGRTPTAPGEAHALPVTTALFLPAASGQATLRVEGFVAGVSVGVDTRSVTLTARHHDAVTVTLAVPLPDAATPADLASHDLGAPDLAIAVDLAVADESVADAALPDDAATGDALAPDDLLNVDQVTIPPRTMFLLPASSPVLGTLDELDGACAAAATDAALEGTFIALIAYPTVDPADRITIQPGRAVRLPDGSLVCDDKDLFSLAHDGPINQLATGEVIASGCVWTQFGPGGNRVPTSSDCQGWTSAAADDFAGVGDVGATDVAWSLADVQACDAQQCHVYCLAQ